MYSLVPRPVHAQYVYPEGWTSVDSEGPATYSTEPLQGILNGMSLP